MSSYHVHDLQTKQSKQQKQQQQSRPSWRQFANHIVPSASTYGGAFNEGDYFCEQGTFTSLRFGPTVTDFLIGNFQMRDKSALPTIVCKGSVPGYTPGMSYKIEGTVVNDKKWGLQVSIRKSEPVLPTTLEDVKAFLSSGAIRHIGPGTASNICNRFGENTLSILKENPKRLLEVKGIGPKTIDDIIEDCQTKLVDVAETSFFYQIGLSTQSAKQVINSYGGVPAEAVLIIKKNPYLLCRIKGFGFLRADEVAKKLGVKPNDPNRIQCGIIYSMRYLCGSRGHTVITPDELDKHCTEKLRITDMNALRVQKDVLVRKKRLIVNTYGYQLRRLWDAENNIKNYLSHVSTASSPILDEKLVESLMMESMKKNGMKLSASQQDAIRNVFSDKRLSILTGHAGTGKTAVCKTIHDVAENAGLKVCLLAPTGRAASHLAEVVGTSQGYTIHRALNIYSQSADEKDYTDDSETVSGLLDGDSTDLSRTASSRFLASDIVIVDEASMLDTEIAGLLMKQCQDRHLMLVGDPGQLPSIGEGSVLHDLTEMALVKRKGLHVHLEKVFRQKSGSPVINAANRVLDGKNPVFTPGVTFIETKSAEEIPSIIQTRILPYLHEKHLGYMDYLLLSPMRKTKYAGVNDLNSLLRPILNYHYHKPDDEKHEFFFQQGDLVMQIVNDYEKHVYNGEVGIVTMADGNRKASVFFTNQSEEIDYIGEELYGDTKELSLAYAMTVHKAQGQQAKIAIVIMTQSQFPMLSRNLLYTAITRAENEVIFIGDKKAFAMSAKNDKDSYRRTGLKYWNEILS